MTTVSLETSVPTPGPVRARASGNWFNGLNVLLLALTGAVIISIAYACNRLGYSGASALFWLGQALLLLPVAWRVLSRSAATGERLLLLSGVAAAQALVVFAYSPDMYRFNDELQHYRTADDILQTGQLFGANSFLPVSPGFPGLEEAATAVTHLTGLSLFYSGVIVVSVAHTILPIVIFMLLREISKSSRLAAVGALVYATCPHNGYFNALFLYTALALPFLVLTLRGVVRSLHGARLWLVAPPFLVVLITHHLTALAALAIWAAILGVAAFARVEWRRVLQSAGALLLACGVASVWTWWQAPATFGYLAGPITRALGRSTTGGRTADIVSKAPLWETMVTLGAAALTVALIVVGLVQLRRSRARRLLRAFAALGLAYPLVLVVRVVAPGGAELASRGLTYVELVAALPAAVGLIALYDRWPRPSRRWVSFVMVTILFAGSLTAALPPFWGRLPGTFQVDSAESGVDRSVAAIGPWAREELAGGTDQQVACDTGVCSMVAANSQASVYTNSASVFTAASVVAANKRMHDLGLQYLVVDRRVTTQVPSSGSYFYSDPLAGRHTSPLPPETVAKFDQDPQIDRVYDNGNVRVYSTSRTWGG